MNQRTLLGVAAALTAFVLVIIGALVGRVTQTAVPSATDVIVAPTQAPTDAPVALDPTVEALIREREAAYRQALNEANQRITEANQRLEEANRRIEQQAAAQQAAAQQAAAQQAAAQQAAAQQAAAQQSAPTYPVSAEQAQAIAQNLAQGAYLVKPAELVLYQGAPAYEIVFDAGAVYVDAQSGTVLANTLAQPVASQPVNAEQAAQIALAYRGGGQIRKVEFERERGIDVYEVKFTDGAEVYVAASDGAVVYARLDKAKEEEKRDDDEKRSDDD
ncbi:PepSY domain-containing protein [Roseiflexus castenholzii]|uniref:Propeptide PepSY amd peptidase M4 n=1 Tax=Roseiflexus castenholzii (strain DSM 13941 / HLO8) TaxID=383372 RepID=A7NFX7_ROSCS|nr:PepSY domain-containing protein [Roseiflexus castenholzii]ABU56361.1 Propeptide PepSY amd peptidase M4 [Roseiflexus castenholzii DSM 13941]